MSDLYLFSSDRLYPHSVKKSHPNAVLPGKLTWDEGGGCRVIPDVLQCYDIKTDDQHENFLNATAWTFKIVGYGDTVFITHYAWALVRDTPENRKALLAWRDAQDVAEREQRKASALFKCIQNVKTPKAVHG